MFIASITKKIVFNDDKPSIAVLFESDYTKEIRIAMKPGQEMKAHKTKFPIVVEIFSGAIIFGVNDKKHALVKGDIIALEGNVVHDLVAVEESIIRLSLSKQDDVNRVKNIVE